MSATSLPVLCKPLPTGATTPSRQPRSAASGASALSGGSALSGDFALSGASPVSGTAAGYSLLEVLIVVAILGLMAALAAPPFLRMIEQQSEVAELAQSEQALRALPLRARELRRDMVLRPAGAARTDVELPPFATPLAEPMVVDFEGLADGWRATVNGDIWIRYDGVCYGGSVTMVSPRGRRFQYELSAPLCEPVRTTP